MAHLLAENYERLFKTKLREGTWSYPQTESEIENAEELVEDLEAIAERANDLIGDDLFYDNLQGAIERARELIGTGRSQVENTITEEQQNGLDVRPHSQIDAQKINQLIADPDFPYHGEWDPKYGTFFFPEENETIDDLEAELDEWFHEKGINVQYEGV